MIPRLLFLCALWLLAISAAGQRELYGTVKDRATGKPIPFVNVFFQGDQQRGVITNEQGNFKLQLASWYLKDTLVFSELGYQLAKKAVADIPTDTLLMTLEEASLPLPEVTVFSDEGLRKIVREALRRLPEQYGARRTLLRAYYREYSITNSAYTEMLEGLVSVEDGAFKYPPQESFIFLEEFRRTRDYRNLPEELAETTENSIYQLYDRFNYVLGRINHLFERNPRGFLGNYQFFNNGEFLDGRDTLIRIGFIFAKNGARSRAGGSGPYRLAELTIRKSDFGIVRLRQGGDEAEGYSEVVYQKIDGRYFPLRMQVQEATRFGPEDHAYLNARQLYILRVWDREEQREKRIKKGKLIRRELDMRDIRYTYNEHFWRENELIVNIPAPEALRADLMQREDLSRQFRATAKKRRN